MRTTLLALWVPCAAVLAQPQSTALHLQVGQLLWECPLPAAIAEPPAGIRPLPDNLLENLYTAVANRPLWTDRNARPGLQTALASLRDDGLDPAHYPLPPVDRNDACAELQRSQAWALAAWHLMEGRLERDHHEPLWRAPGIAAPGGADRRLLQLLIEYREQPGLALAAARPVLPAYRGLQSALAALQAGPDHGPAIPSGPTLRADARDPRVALLRARLLQTGDLDPARAGNAAQADYFDEPLAAALRRFQYRHGLEEDAALGPRSLAALNLGADERRDRLRANLERWRWRAAEPFESGVLVDIAGARIEYREHGERRWWARTQVGTAARPTPALHSLIQRLTVNPAWVVPPTIFRQDKLPALREDPAYLDNHNMEVVDLSGNLLDPAGIDWRSPRGILLRQRPGPENPLGRVAIRFANPFSVYLHDTPSQRLFSRAHRDQSSGCVRVEEAMTLAMQLLETAAPRHLPGWHDMLDSGQTRELLLDRPVPILLDYWTADVDDDGRVILRPDLYQRDAALAAALTGTAP